MSDYRGEYKCVGLERSHCTCTTNINGQLHSSKTIKGMQNLAMKLSHTKCKKYQHSLSIIREVIVYLKLNKHINNSTITTHKNEMGKPFIHHENIMHLAKMHHIK